MENSRKGKTRHTKQQYLLELLLGSTRLDIPGIWGITAAVLQRKLIKWGMATLAEEDQALEEYRNSLPKPVESEGQTNDIIQTPLLSEDTVNDTSQKLPLADDLANKPCQAASIQPERENLFIWMKIPVVHVSTPYSEQMDVLKQSIHELSLETNCYHGRGQLVFKAMEVMFAMTSMLYLDAHELLKSELPSKQQLRRLMISTNKQHMHDVKVRIEQKDWKAISQ